MSKPHPYLPELSDLTRNLKNRMAGIAELDEREKLAKERIDSILADGKIDDDEVRELSDQRTLLDILIPKREQERKLVAVLGKNVRARQRDDRSRWNQAVRETVANKEGEILTAALPFSRGRETYVKKELLRIEWPPVREIRRLGFHSDLGPEPSPDLVLQDAELFLSLVEKNAALVGFGR